MNAPPKVYLISLRDLHRELEEGRYAVPKLQREFVWNGRKAAMLLDSVCKNMPIGSLVVWNAKRSARDMLRTNLNILPPYRKKNSRILFLIDGQQRLSVLYQAFQGEPRRNSSQKVVNFAHLTFSLERNAQEDAPAFRYRSPVEGEFISVKDILSPGWRSKTRGLGVRKIERVRQCRLSLLGYEVPVVQFETNDLDEIRELFIRINSLGTPIASADRAFARASVIDLRALAHEAWDELPPGFRVLRYESILQTLALVEGVKDVGERSYEPLIRRWERDAARSPARRAELLRTWGRLRQAFGKAVDYLHQYFSVLEASYLPSENMVALLAVYFFEQGGVPSAAQAREIRKWFWSTAVCQRYSGRGFRKNILKDVRFFRGLARRRTRFVLSERADAGDLLRAEFQRRAALIDGAFCLLAKHQPTHFKNGAPIPQAVYQSRSNRKNKHHIFPRALLKRVNVPDRQINSVCNISFITAEENQEIGSKPPLKYLGALRKKRFFGPSMRSHLMPHGSKSGLWAEAARAGFAVFVRQRQVEICRAFEREAGMRLFRRDTLPG